jgi:hypothetical protein
MSKVGKSFKYLMAFIWGVSCAAAGFSITTLSGFALVSVGAAVIWFYCTELESKNEKR